jgi:ABC-type multidrug transport system fused ATPase/permease subunit
LGGLKEEDMIEKKIEMVEKVYEAQENKNVLFACLTAFKKEYARSVVTQIFQCAGDMYQPYILKEIVTLLVSKDHDADVNTKIIEWSVFLVVIRFFKYLIDEHDFYHNLKTGCASAQVIKSMIFKKQLKLTPSTSKNYEQGQIDGVKGCADRFTWFSWEMSDFIKTPIIFVFVLYRLTALMSWSFVPSLILMIICIQIDRKLDKLLVPIHKARDKINEKLGNNITNTLNNIKALKLYGWDNHF